MTKRMENFAFYGIQILLGCSSYLIGALYFSRILDVYLETSSGINIDGIVTTLFNSQINLDPIPLTVSTAIASLLGVGLIYLSYYLIKESIIGLRILEKKQIMGNKSKQINSTNDENFLPKKDKESSS
ncbi:hypothetical protein [Candidatus Hodarchaeum mangrovi]